MEKEHSEGPIDEGELIFARLEYQVDIISKGIWPYSWILLKTIGSFLEQFDPHKKPEGLEEPREDK
jgi:hypothetical protein